MNRIWENYFKNIYFVYIIDMLEDYLINNLICLAIFLFYYFCLYDSKNTLVIPIAIWIAFEIINCLLVYRTAILLFIDKIKGSVCKSENVKIKNLKGEYSWSGNLGYTKVHKYFSKNKYVDKYKLYYESNEGSGYIRLLADREDMGDFFVECLKEGTVLNIKYFKHSKVVYEIVPIKGSKKENEIYEKIKRLTRISLKK